MDVPADEDGEEAIFVQTERPPRLGAVAARRRDDADGQDAHVGEPPVVSGPVGDGGVVGGDARGEAGAAAERGQRAPLGQVQHPGSLRHESHVLGEDARKAPVVRQDEPGDRCGVDRVLDVDEIGAVERAAQLADEGGRGRQRVGDRETALQDVRGGNPADRIPVDLLPARSLQVPAAHDLHLVSARRQPAGEKLGEALDAADVRPEVGGEESNPHRISIEPCCCIHTFG